MSRISLGSLLQAVAIDNAISFDGDPDAFIAQVHFRNTEEEQFKPVLADFIRATAGLRKQIRETFDAQPVRMRIWVWTAQVKPADGLSQRHDDTRKGTGRAILRFVLGGQLPLPSLGALVSS